MFNIVKTIIELFLLNKNIKRLFVSNGDNIIKSKVVYNVSFKIQKIQLIVLN